MASVVLRGNVSRAKEGGIPLALRKRAARRLRSPQCARNDESCWSQAADESFRGPIRGVYLMSRLKPRPTNRIEPRLQGLHTRVKKSAPLETTLRNSLRGPFGIQSR